VVKQTASLTPLALVATWLVWLNPPRWLREGSVSASLLVICWFNLRVEGNATATAALFGAMCVLITALFGGVVMRVRFQYASPCIATMSYMGLWFLVHAGGMSLSERVGGSSMLMLGLGLIAVASYSLEREERRSFLFGLQRDLEAEELASTNEVLQRLSGIDKLTGLPNRRALEERMEGLWEHCAAAECPLSVVVIDVDNFKVTNDVHGHLYGDQVLQRIGILLPQALRSAEDMAARFGGEEFVLLLSDTSASSAMIVAERARQLTETVGTPPRTPLSDENLILTTVSCGVSSCVPNSPMTWMDLIAAADEALYAAKRAGRNRVEFRDCRPRLTLPQSDVA
jgi:diguanylate cyclase (GGDEF)-like protein